MLFIASTWEGRYFNRRRSINGKMKSIDKYLARLAEELHINHENS
jgi:hypothetical protein